ncbi:hypothetical protein AAMO2058_000828900 [Amorphochlora amoebiformis]
MSVKAQRSSFNLDGKDGRLVCQEFTTWGMRNPDSATAVAAIQALTKVIERSKAQTLMELQEDLKAAMESLKSMDENSITLAAGCELFSRYVTRTSLDIPDFDTCKKRLISRGKVFAENSIQSRTRISKFGDRFIQDNARILIHGRSRVVAQLLNHAHQKHKKFSVYISEGRPKNHGYLMAEELKEMGIYCTLILDSAVAATMDDIDMVLVGAEAVVENGGIINTVGTYQMAMVASLLNKPVYVAAESYKFSRLFPLSQKDIKQRNHVEKPPILSCIIKLREIDPDRSPDKKDSKTISNLSSNSKSKASLINESEQQGIQVHHSTVYRFGNLNSFCNFR